MDGREILVNVASIGFGHAPDMRSCRRTGRIKRAIYFSTTSLFTTLPAASKAVRDGMQSGSSGVADALDHFRPTMIYGNPGDRQSHPAHPVGRSLADGTGLRPRDFFFQPVHATTSPGQSPVPCRTGQSSRAYNLSGGTVLNYNEMVRLVGELLGRRPRLLHLPMSASLILCGLIAKTSPTEIL